MKQKSCAALIYADTGVSDMCVQQWRLRCKQYGLAHDTIDAQDIERGNLDGTKIFILPGGADVPYCEKLNGAGNRVLRKFVERGGTFVGVCAGAYYMHAEIQWKNACINKYAKDEELIIGARELSFFNGPACGPLVPYCASCESGARFVTMYYKNTSACVYYNGGPIMFADGKTDVLAVFSYGGKTYPAVLQKRAVLGHVFAFAVHLEYTEDALQIAGAPRDDNREQIFEDIFRAIILA